MSFRGLILLYVCAGLEALAQEPSASRRLETARQLKGHASAAVVAGEYEAALPAVRASRDRALLAQALLEAGQSALAAGDYPRAFDRAHETEGLFHDLKDAANEALAANLAGSADLYRGSYDGAIHDFGRALRLDRARRDAKGEIVRLSNIGNVYFFQGKYADALANYEAALARVNATAGELWNPARRQLVLTNLATLYEQLGQYEKARGYYDEALARGASLPASEYGQLLANAGTLYRRLGDPVKALESYRAAQTLFSREHLSVAEIHVLQNFGIAQALDFHDLSRASEAFTSALKLAESPLNKRESVLAHLFRGEVFYRMGRMQGATEDFTNALAGAREIGAREEQWTALYGLGRIEGRIDPQRALETFRQAIGIIEAVRSGLGNSSLKAEFLANKRDVYDAVIALLLDSPEHRTDVLFPMIEQARSRNLQDALRGAAGPPALQSIQRQLTPGSLVIEYWMGAGAIAALWTTRDRSGIVSRKVTADELAGIREYGAILRSAHDSAWRSEAQRLGELLLGGVPLEGVTHLLIVPDGVLNAIPFEAIAKPLLIERFPVSYLPSAALLLRKPEHRFPAPPWRRQLLAFGDPVVNQGSALPGDARWDRLPDSRRELHAIAGALRGRSSIHAAEDDRKQYLFSSETAGTPLLHFSTHAVVDMTDPNRSRILFSGSEYLFRSEVQWIPLRGVDLVTLSACDTESGKLSRGEGIQSFSRAFLAGGAQSTVTTLWRVADSATADFMQAFYQHLARGEAKADALRAVKLRFLRSGGDPGHWAAFVLNGDGRAPIQAVFSWLWILGPLLAVAVFNALYRRRRSPEPLVAMPER